MSEPPQARDSQVGSTQTSGDGPLHVLDAICVAAYFRLQQDSDPLAVSNLMWGLAKLEHHPGRVMTESMEAHLLPVLHKVTPHTASTALWVRRLSPPLPLRCSLLERARLPRRVTPHRAVTCERRHAPRLHTFAARLSHRLFGWRPRNLRRTPPWVSP